MILEKRPRPNLRMVEEFTNGNERINDMLQSFMRLLPTYRGAMKEVSTKLEVLDEEFQVMHDHNPIHHIECRMKTGESIVEKMARKKIPFTLADMKAHVQDIAGLRVVCNYTSDIYQLCDVLTKQDDIVLVRKTDYIKNPKPSGYRSLHIVVMVPVFLVDATELVPVEIQMRTIAMDMWASLEHELRYKSREPIGPREDQILRDCADDLASVDRRMMEVFGRRSRGDEK